jgi:hypothetical protein
MMRNEDLSEDDLARIEESTVVMQTSYSDRQPLFNSHTVSSHRFMPLSGSVRYSLNGSERKLSVRPPNKFKKLKK